jgi:hypothetical protein
MLSAARASAENYGAGFVEVTTAEELIDYLNQGKNRDRSPIEHLCLFSHGIPHQVAFGYELAGGYRLALNVLNYREMSPSAFSSTARLDSYACRTGMGNRSEYPVEDGIQFFSRRPMKVWRSCWLIICGSRCGRLFGVRITRIPGGRLEIGSGVSHVRLMVVRCHTRRGVRDGKSWKASVRSTMPA